ncbi:MAG: hypothetical protein HYZ39_08455 [Mycolicibacterium cosmeticum]|nr:hypothetical protein [Mycolicibacterium cosmeticum]
MAVIDVRTYGAAADGTTDDHPAITAALQAAHDAGGGTVFLPAGTYALATVLSGDFAKVFLVGDGDRASTLLATGPSTVITGTWTECRIENLTIDAGGHGGAGVVVDLDKSYLRHCWVRRWQGFAISLNPNAIGLLNWIDDNFVEQCDGTGIHTTYRFYDSWIVNNNVGSTGPNLSVEAGPVRILANHLDGSPRHNIELRGNKSLTIIGNICEGAHREAVIYTMPDWLAQDAPQVQIVGNNITNGGKEEAGRWPAIGIYSRDAQHRTSGFGITGNFIACTDDDAGWSHAVDAEFVDTLAITGNQWDNRGFTVAAVRAAGEHVGVAGNTSANRTAVFTVTGADVTLGEEGVYLSAGATRVWLPSGSPGRYTVKNTAAGTVRVSPQDGQIDELDHVDLGRGAVIDLVSDGTAWFTL